jgi:hypothetical protein
MFSYVQKAEKYKSIIKQQIKSEYKNLPCGRK